MGWFRIDRVTWGERVLWAAFVALSIAPVALRPSNEEVARAYVAAINRGDVEAALDLTTADFVIRPALGGYYYRWEATRQVLEYRAALHERWQILSWEDTGKEIHVGLQVTNDAWALVGIRPTMTVILVVRDGRLLYEITRTDGKGMRRALQTFLQWVTEQRASKLDRVWHDGEPVRRADSARWLVRLLREWRAAEGAVDGAPAEEQA